MVYMMAAFAYRLCHTFAGAYAAGAAVVGITYRPGELVTGAGEAEGRYAVGARGHSGRARRALG